MAAIAKSHAKEEKYDITVCCVDGKTDTYVNVRMESNKTETLLMIFQSNNRVVTYPLCNIVRMVCGFHE